MDNKVSSHVQQVMWLPIKAINPTWPQPRGRGTTKVKDRSPHKHNREHASYHPIEFDRAICP